MPTNNLPGRRDPIYDLGLAAAIYHRLFIPTITGLIKVASRRSADGRWQPTANVQERNLRCECAAAAAADDVELLLLLEEQLGATSQQSYSITSVAAAAAAAWLLFAVRCLPHRQRHTLKLLIHFLSAAPAKNKPMPKRATK